MPKLNVVARLLLLLSTCLTAPLAAYSAPGMTTPPSPQYKTALTLWRAAERGFAGWQLNGVALDAGGSLRLDPQAATWSSDSNLNLTNGLSYYNGGAFLVGEATSPVTPSTFRFSQAVPSWNASTPPGTWVEVQLRGRTGARWTRWYSMGVWASDESTVKRHSMGRQRDLDGYVSVDTLVLNNPRRGLSANAFQLRLRLFATDPANVPTVSSAAVAVSTKPTTPAALATGNPKLWGKRLAVPQCSQMVYPDGGEVWCSPTSTSMVLAYWRGDTSACEPRVRAAVDGVYDHLYDGHGNWPFNTAYAAMAGLEGYVARFATLAEAEKWIAAGVPVILSFGWGRGELTGASIPSSNGHLAVLVGFDGAGNPIVNDPAAPTNNTVQRTYPRAELERLWLKHSGGTVYLIYPPGHPVRW
ncbi:MAG: peptidase C39 family protein [Chloroflexota bacterium]|nr:peptidase C39 family protein [Chloroflexota bacterium]